MYILNLAEDKRILSAWVFIEGQNYGDMPIVNMLPDGNVSDYKYINNEYIYDPLPEPEPIEPEPTIEEVMNALLGMEV